MRTIASSILLVAACGFPHPAEHSTDGAADASPDAPSDAPAPCPSGGCQLLAIEPSIANTGDTIMLEGTFGTSATVTFPGGATAQATVLGPHRATAIVPAGATAGDLAVTSGGTTVGPVSFRRASFQLGLQQFQLFDEQTLGGRQMPSLVTGTNAQALVATHGFVYVAGGFNGTSTPIATVERAPIQADGSLGAFQTLTTTLTTPRRDAVALAIGDDLYVLGGDASGTVERAVIQADGSLGAFTVVSALTAPRFQFTANVIGSFVYALAGNDGSTSTLAVERAAIAPDGSLGPFAATSVSLEVAESTAYSVVIGAHLYVLGGGQAVESAPIAADGTLGAFAVSGNLTTSRISPSIFVVGSNVYVVGGAGQTTVEAAPINLDGTLGTFAIVSGVSLPNEQGGGFCLAGDYAYLIGGSEATAGSSSRVQRASLNASGAIGTTIVATQPGVPNVGGATIIVGNTVYSFGNGGSNNLAAAPLAQDGTVGSFALTTSSVPTCLNRLQATRIGSFVYIVGGGPCANSALASVYQAPIQADGTLGSFALLSSTHLVTGRLSNVSIVAGANLYVIGGWYTSETGVERAPINADGTLGAFATTTVTTTVPRMDASAAVIGNFIYVFGGANTSESAPIASIERIALDPDGSLNGTFESAGSLAVARFFPGVVVVGSFVYVFGGDVSGSTVERAAINPDGTLGTFKIVPGLTAPANTPTFIAGNAVQSCGFGSAGCSELALQ